MTTTARLTEAAFDPARELAEFAAEHDEAGGIASFVGQVRQGEDVEALELNHYPLLTLQGIEALAARAAAHWQLEGLLIVHRVGLMSPSEPIVLVGAAARHRREAFAAVDYTMDHLKSDAWLWKRERRGGEWHWVEPRPEDHADLARWR